MYARRSTTKIQLLISLSKKHPTINPGDAPLSSCALIPKPNLYFITKLADVYPT